MLCSLILLGFNAAFAAPASNPVRSHLSTDVAHLLSLPDRPAEQGRFVLELAPGFSSMKVARQAAAAFYGVEVRRRMSSAIYVEAPWDAVESLAAVDGVRHLRRLHQVRPKAVFTEGYDSIFSADWHDYGYTGKGIRIAILDSQFAGYEDLLGTELPADVQTHFIGDAWEYGVHGTGVAEVIHDIAPDAELEFFSFADEMDFFDAIDTIAEGDFDLVNASIGFDNVWHADGSSPFAQYVDIFTEETGTAWFAAAGNETGLYWVGNLGAADNEGYLTIDGYELIPVYAEEGQLMVSFRWDESFGQAATDIDIEIYDEDGWILGDDDGECGVGEDTQNGSGDPLEQVVCVNIIGFPWSNGWEEYYVYLRDYSGTATGKKGYLYSAFGVNEKFASATETLTIPADAESAIAVGAVEWWSNLAADYSSRGPTNDGRIKPDISAPTAVSTKSYGSAQMGNPNSGFAGTSAATPHATGVAALVLEASGGMSRTDLAAWLADHTEDLGASGKDNTYGAGLLALGEPPTSFDVGNGDPEEPLVCGCQTQGTSPLIALLACLAPLLRRQRR